MPNLTTQPLLYPGGPAYHAAPAPAAAGAAPLTFAPTDWRAAARAAGGRQLNSLNVGGMSGASMMAGPMSLTPTHASAGMARPPAPWAALPTSTATPAATSTGGVVPTSAAPFAAVATTTAPAAAAFPAQPSGTTAGAGAPTVANVPMPMPLHTSSSLPAFGTALSQAPIHTTATVPASAPVAWPGPAIYAAAGVAVPTSTAAAGASAGGIPPTAPKTKKSSGHKRGSSWDGHAVSRKHKSSGHRHRHHHHKPSSTGGLSANTSERSGPPSDYGDYGDDLGTPSSWSNPSSQCPSENGDRDSDFNTSLDPNSVEGIRLDERLRQLITTDPTRARRIIANRRSAARSKVKQANGVSDLQERAQALGAEVSDLNSEGTRLSQAGLELTLEQANLRAEVAQWESRISAANAEAHSLRETLKQLGVNPAEVEARAVPAANAASAMAVKLHHERQHAAAMAAASAQAAGAQRQQFPMGAGGTASAAPRRKSPTSGRRKAAPPPIQVPPTAGGMPVPSPVGFMTAQSAPTTPLTATSDISGMHTVASTSNIAGQMNMHAG
ncbi:BZIP domain-containing protein [Pycnococcus provasolii]